MLSDAVVHDTQAVRWCPVPGVRKADDALKRTPFGLPDLEVTGTVAVCDVAWVGTDGIRPSMSVSITQFVCLSDGSMVRLDMDRGFTAVRYGPDPASWKRAWADVRQEVLALVQVDDPAGPGMVHPWNELAEAARRRGVRVTEETLRQLPYRVMLTEEVIALFEL